MLDLVSVEEGTKIIEAIETDRRTAIDYLLNYNTRLRDYKHKKQEDLVQQKPLSGGGRGSLPGKPTETMAVRSAAYDEEHIEYRWLRAVEITERTLSDKKLLFLQVRREAGRHGHGAGQGRPGWVPYVQARFPELFQQRYLQSGFYLSDRTAHAWWDAIVDFSVAVFLRLR